MMDKRFLYVLLVLGAAALIYGKLSRHRPRLMSPKDADYPQLVSLKLALEKSDDMKLKKIVNALLLPPETRCPGCITANSTEELSALSARLGVKPDSASFRYFLALYTGAPLLPSARRGYQIVEDPTQKSPAEKSFTRAKAELAPGEKMLFGGADTSGRVVVLSETRMFANGKWFPVETKRYPHSVAYQSEAGTVVIEQTTEGIPEFKFNGEAARGWPVYEYDSALPR